MNTVHAPRHGRRLAVTLAAASALTMLAAVAAQPAYAQLATVPPGCGVYSGTMVPVGQLDDHSNDPQPLGTFGVDSSGDFYDTPYQVPLVADIIVVGTTGFTDNIRGNVFDNVICGRGGDDWIRGGFGIDEIYGAAGADSLWGEQDGDVLHGGPGRDTLHGDNAGDNFADEIHGGTDDDWMWGEGGSDEFFGGADLIGDEVFDFDPATDPPCVDVEIGC
jgi:hypothetical protein